MIKPIITLIFTNGTKKKFERYDRPPMLYKTTSLEGKKQNIPFARTGPDEYEQVVTKEKDVEKD